MFFCGNIKYMRFIRNFEKKFSTKDSCTCWSVTTTMEDCLGVYRLQYCLFSIILEDKDKLVKLLTWIPSLGHCLPSSGPRLTFIHL